MSTLDWLPWVLFLVLLGITIPLLGSYMANVFAGKKIPIFYKLELLVYKLAGIDPDYEMNSKEYIKCMLYLNGLGLIFLFVLLLFQGWLPLNPEGFGSVNPTLAFNIAISFVTNTNWQAYGGENTLSYLSQMIGLTVQNYLSAATGFAVLLSLTRGITRKISKTIGNFWLDITRSIIYVLLPLSILFAIVLVSEGVIQNFNAYVNAETLLGDNQIIPMGPAASQIAIKQIGTNGGGFFNANSAHPFENPTPFTNFLEMFAIILIPAALVYMYGVIIQSKSESWIIFSVMFALWLVNLSIASYSEGLQNPTLGVDPVLEGKETRISVDYSVFWAVLTTATANGSVNNMQSSLSPLAGGISIFNILTEEVIFGGIGVGLSSMLMFVVFTVFIAGLMVGRTPEYMGKKIEKFEMQWVMQAILAPSALVLIGTGVAVILPSVLASLGNSGPHGFSEILYAYTSAAGNNGSAFAGLGSNTPFFNITLGLVMLLSRLAILIPTVVIAGSLARKKIMAPSQGTLSTNGLLFGILLTTSILIVSSLTFFPALSLGPIIEHFLMLQGQTF